MKQNPNTPLQWWFQDTSEGLALFIVFYTLACKYGRCVGCNLYMQVSQTTVDCFCLMNQIDEILKQPEIIIRQEEIKKIIISNNGSVLDQRTFSSTALMYFIAVAGKNLPNSKILSIETRTEYVDDAELEFLSRARKDTYLDNIEIAIGVEAYSDFIRNDLFKKGLRLEDFEKFVQKVSLYGFLIKCYFMFKPTTGITTEESIRDIQDAIHYLSWLAAKYGAKINMHLNPTYVARGTKLEVDFLIGNYTPPLLSDVVKSISAGRGSKISIFIGLYDEGLAVEGGSFIRQNDGELIEKLNQFNKTQNYDLLT